jgi:Lon-like ATP-dependent protease
MMTSLPIETFDTRHEAFSFFYAVLSLTVSFFPSIVFERVPLIVFLFPHFCHNSSSNTTSEHFLVSTMLRAASRKTLASFGSRRQAFSAPWGQESWRCFSSADDDEAGSNNPGGEDNNNGKKRAPLSIIVPSRIGTGDEAPRMPHVLALPVLNRPLFPGVVTSVTLTEPATIDALENLQKDNQNAYISVFLRKKHYTGVSEGGVLLTTPEVIVDPEEIYKVGTFAQIHQLKRGVGSLKGARAAMGGESEDSSDDEGGSAASLLLRAHRRVDLVSVDEIGPPIDVTISHWPRLDYTGGNDTIRALSNEILITIREVAQLNPLFRENVQFFTMHMDPNDPYRLSDFAASVCSAGNPEDLQALLEEKDPEMRLHKALVLLSREREVSKLQQEISAKVEEKMSEAQRRYFLMEQLK